MKVRRILAFILALTILMGNTMTVFATSSTVSENDIVNVETEEVVEEGNGRRREYCFRGR